MVFPYTIVSTPNANDDPADDVDDMRANYLNIGGFLQVDHVAAGTNDGGIGAGFHKKVTYYGNATPYPPQDSPVPLSDSYTVPGVAQSSKVQLVWKNTAGVFPQSAIRAFGNFLTQAVVVAPPNQITPTSPTSWYNVNNIVHSAGQVYVINLTPGIFFFGASQPTVLISTSGVGGAGAPVDTAYTLAANTLTITVSSDTANSKINFVILQF